MPISARPLLSQEPAHKYTVYSGIFRSFLDLPPTLHACIYEDPSHTFVRSFAARHLRSSATVISSSPTGNSDMFRLYYKVSLHLSL